MFLVFFKVYLVTDTIYCTTYHEGGFVPPLWAMVAESVSSLLVMINFSGNFLIYCCTLKPFKAYIASWIGNFRKTPDRYGHSLTLFLVLLSFAIGGPTLRGTLLHCAAIG